MTNNLRYLHEEIYSPLTEEIADQIINAVDASIETMLVETNYFDSPPDPIKQMIGDIKIILSRLKDHQVIPPR